MLFVQNFHFLAPEVCFSPIAMRRLDESARSCRRLFSAIIAQQQTATVPEHKRTHNLTKGEKHANKMGRNWTGWPDYRSVSGLWPIPPPITSSSFHPCRLQIDLDLQIWRPSESTRADIDLRCRSGSVKENDLWIVQMQRCGGQQMSVWNKRQLVMTEWTASPRSQTRAPGPAFGRGDTNAQGPWREKHLSWRYMVFLWVWPVETPNGLTIYVSTCVKWWRDNPVRREISSWQTPEWFHCKLHSSSKGTKILKSTTKGVFIVCSKRAMWSDMNWEPPMDLPSGWTRQPHPRRSEKW